MKTRITIKSYGAMAIGIVFALTTLVVLCEDLFHNAPLTIQHLLTITALVGTVTAGHMISPALREGRIIAALGLTILFLAGTVFTVVSAGSRNSEVQVRKAELIDQANADRATAAAERKSAQQMLDEESARLARECRSGAGAKCKGIQASIDVYKAAVKGHDATLEKLGPARSANAGYHHSAKVFSALSGVPADSIESALILIMPFLLVVIVEFGTLVFLSVAFTCETFTPPAPPADRAPVPEREETDTEKVADFAQRYKAKHGTNPSQAVIRQALDLPKATCWRIYHELRLAA